MPHDSHARVGELAVRHRNRGVVGFRIADAEATYPDSGHVEVFDYLESNSLPATVNAGEGAGLESLGTTDQQEELQGHLGLLLVGSTRDMCRPIKHSGVLGPLL